MEEHLSVGRWLVVVGRWAGRVFVGGLLVVGGFLICHSLRKENLQILNNMFTPLGINHTHNTCAAANHLLDISQNQTTH